MPGDLVQQVLVMETRGHGGLRDQAEGWTAEDPRGVRPGPIGRTPGFPEPYTFPTPMHALCAGWRLLAPPSRVDDESFEWWFVREVPRG